MFISLQILNDRAQACLSIIQNIYVVFLFPVPLVVSPLSVPPSVPVAESLICLIC